MKHKILLTLAAGTLALTVAAQSFTSYDAFNLTNTELNGTARFVGVGGAMGALGGDATTIHYNPAGIGIYRSSEVTASLNVHWNNATVGNCGQSRYTTANLENVAYVGHWDIGAAKGKTTGLIGISFGAAYNRTKNYDRNGYYSRSKDYSKSQWLAKDAEGLDPDYLNKENFYNENVGYRAIFGYETWAIDDIEGTDPQKYTNYYDLIGGGGVTDQVNFVERGHSDEFALSIAGNVSDIFYLGMSFVCDFMDYRRYEDYYEKFSNGSYMKSYNNFYASGTGFTYKVGFIVRPTNWLRIGGAYHTPSYYRFSSNNYGTADASLYITLLDKTISSNITGITNYENGYINGPMKAIGSLGFLLGKYGFVGLEYQWTNVSGMNIKNSYGRVNTTMNEQTKTYFCDTHTARIGLEIKPIDEMSIRLGGGYTTAPTRSDASRYYYRTDTRTDTYYINEKDSYNVTCGLGYRIGRHSIDLAYIWQVNTGDYYEFNNSDMKITPMTIRNVRNQIYVSYAVRF